jgi:two-component system NarL family sensor kinase
MLRLQEKERQKIAAELHDSVGQTILAAKLNFTTFMMQPGEMGERYDAGLELIDRASQELREIYQNLYPSILRDLGLEAAIRWYAKNYLEVKGIETGLSFVLTRRLPEELEAGIFRMVQELFNNIVKHSSASRATLKLTRKKNTVHLSVSDDGAGFDINEARYKGGLGIANLRSRVEDLGGEIQIESGENKGTTTEIHLPLVFRLKDM